MYRSIATLPLNRFIDCYVNQNFSALIISGFPKETELMEAWMTIQEEYADAIKDNDGKMYLSLLRDVTLLDGNLKIIHCLVKIMMLADEVLPEMAKDLNKRCKTSFLFGKNKNVELKRCLNRSKALKIQLDLKTMQLQGFKTKFESNNVKPSHEYFTSILITLSDHAKYAIQETITVLEFCNRIERFNQYCEQLKLSAHGRRSD